MTSIGIGLVFFTNANLCCANYPLTLTHAKTSNSNNVWIFSIMILLHFILILSWSITKKNSFGSKIMFDHFQYITQQGWSLKVLIKVAPPPQLSTLHISDKIFPILGSIIGMVAPLDSHRLFIHFGNVFEPYHALVSFLVYFPCLAPMLVMTLRLGLQHLD